MNCSFFCALKALHDGNFNEVRSYVQQTRDRIDGTLTALVSESYIRAYDEIVKLQQLAEIEEIINYKGNIAINIV
jgi:FKBP12-rapamycin complex-associated protein